MEKDNRRRPTERSRSGAERTRPRDSRPRTGSASTREAERRARMAEHAGQEAARRTRAPEQTRTRQTPTERSAAQSARRSPEDRRPREAAPDRRAHERSAAKRNERAAARSARTRAAAGREREAAAPKRRKKKPHRVYNTNFGFKFVTMLAVVAVIVLSMVIFFKVKSIEVVFLGVQPAVPAAPAETTAPAAETGQTDTRQTETDLPAESGAETGPAETGPAETAGPADTGTTDAPTEPSAPGGEETPPAATEPAEPELIEGHSCYTAAEIIEASGIQINDNLLSLSKVAVVARIQKALPYVNEVQIKKQLPGTVIIMVSEFEVTYGIQDETGLWWLMSREGRILEAASEQSIRGHMTITGMPIQKPQPGDWFKPSAADGADLSEIAAKQKVVLDLIPALEKTPYAKQIVRVDVSTSYDLTLWYGTRYEIRLGTTEELDYKLRFLEAALADKEIQRRSGVIDLTFNEDKKAHFMDFQ